MERGEGRATSGEKGRDGSRGGGQPGDLLLATTPPSSHPARLRLCICTNDIELMPVVI